MCCLQLRWCYPFPSLLPESIVFLLDFRFLLHWSDTLRLDLYSFCVIHCPLLAFPQKKAIFSLGWMWLNTSKINSFVPFCNSLFFVCVCKKNELFGRLKITIEQICWNCIYLWNGFSRFLSSQFQWRPKNSYALCSINALCYKFCS